MDADHHDLVLAVTSHAPHLIAYTMVGVADDLGKVTDSEVIKYSAAGFRDFELNSVEFSKKVRERQENRRVSISLPFVIRNFP